jgi:UDP-glucose 4-epimerase
MRKVVVTGGSGFIGSNLAEELADRKEEVIIFDNLSTGRFENIQHLINRENVTFVHGSITDLKLLTETFKDVDYIFHQAAIPSVQRSVENPLATNEANIKGTLNVLIAARDCAVKKVIYASSSSVYGDTPELPKRVDMNPNPLSPYAVSKLTGEYYCKVFSEIYGVDTVCLRYFNVYGPKQDPLSEYAAVIPKFIIRVLNNQPPLIFGDGEQTRDFTFVKDVVKANLLAMEKGKGIFNIACGNRISINELTNKITDIMKSETKSIYEKPRVGDVRDSLADISLAREKLGYSPEYSLEKGLEVTITWFSNLKRN